MNRDRKMRIDPINYASLEIVCDEFVRRIHRVGYYNEEAVVNWQHMVPRKYLHYVVTRGMVFGSFLVIELPKTSVIGYNGTHNVTFHTMIDHSSENPRKDLEYLLNPKDENDSRYMNTYNGMFNHPFGSKHFLFPQEVFSFIEPFVDKKNHKGTVYGGLSNMETAHHLVTRDNGTRLYEYTVSYPITSTIDKNWLTV